MMKHTAALSLIVLLLSGCQFDAPPTAMTFPGEVLEDTLGEVSRDDDHHGRYGKPLPEKAMQHPSIEQLLACDRVEFRIRAEFEMVDNNSQVDVFYATLSAAWKLSTLGGANLFRKDVDSTGGFQSSESVKIDVLENGFRLKVAHSSYHYWSEPGYWEEKDNLMRMDSLRFVRKDSAMYIYRVPALLANLQVRSYRKLESRFFLEDEKLRTGSVIPIGEVIFYK